MYLHCKVLFKIQGIEKYKGAKLVIKALMMAFSQRIINFIGIFHSDRGSEYASEIVQKNSY